MPPSRAQRERMARLLAAESDAELEPDNVDRQADVSFATRRARVLRAKIERLLADPSAPDGELAAARAALARLEGRGVG